MSVPVREQAALKASSISRSGGGAAGVAAMRRVAAITTASSWLGSDRDDVEPPRPDAAPPVSEGSVREVVHPDRKLALSPLGGGFLPRNMAFTASKSRSQPMKEQSRTFGRLGTSISPTQ